LLRSSLVNSYINRLVIFMWQLRAFFFLVFGISFSVIGQKNILVYTSLNDTTNVFALQKIQEAGATYGISFVVAEQRISAELLQTVEAVLFLNKGTNELDYSEAANLELFLKAGGGIAGIHGMATETYQWLWIGKLMRGKLAQNKKNNTQEFSLITNLSLGNVSVAPFWKLNDQPLVFSGLPYECKPVLLDLAGNKWAWTVPSEQSGGKFFYTAFGGTKQAYQNAEFIKHLFAGLKSVLPAKPLALEIFDSLPNELFFEKQPLVENLQNPAAFALLPENKLVILQNNGEFLLHDSFLNKTKNVGILPTFSGVSKLKIDPDYETNHYIYGFLPTEMGYQTQRFVLEGDSLVVLSDFQSQSNTPLVTKQVKYDFVESENETGCLPNYYATKFIRFDDEKKQFFLDTKDEISGELLNREPFLPSFFENKLISVNDLEIDKLGRLFILEENQLSVLDYFEKERLPQVTLSADAVAGKIPFVVNFTATGLENRDESTHFEWQVNNETVPMTPTLTYTFKQSGTYLVKFKLTNNIGTSAEYGVEVIAQEIRRKK
jgi:Trehalose utilisation/PKD domain